MGRKRKQIDPDGLSKSTLPPCRVCDAPGAGFHYGVNTCEACKGFFHRSLKLNGQYKCEGDNDCPIEHGRDKLCQYCRYQKCLTVGMAKEAIKTGRYTSVKRTNDILEIKRLQQSTKRGSPSQSANSHILKLLNNHTASNGSPSTSLFDSDSQTGDGSSSYFGQNSQPSTADCSPSGPEMLTNRPTCQTGSSNFGFPSRSALQLGGLTGSGEVERESVIERLYPFSQGETSQHAFLPGHSSSISTSQTQQGHMDCTFQTSPENLKISRPSGSDLTIGAKSASCSEIHSLFSESPPDSHHLNPCQVPQSALSPGSTLSPLSQNSSYDEQNGIAKSSPSMLTELASSLLSLAASPSSVSSLSVSSFRAATPASTSSSSEIPPTTLLSAPAVSLAAQLLLSPSSSMTSPSSSHSAQGTPLSSTYTSNAAPYSSDFIGTVCNSCGREVNEQDIVEMFMDKDSIVKKLVEANEAHLIPLFGRLTQEEMERQRAEHFEGCKLQHEMFGDLTQLPDHEYDYIYVTTGLDTDDRQTRLTALGLGLEKLIRAMVKFCKVIPGFSSLDIADKISLIKYARHEFCIFCVYVFYDCDAKILRGMDNTWKCMGEIRRLRGDQSMLDAHFAYCRSLQKLNLTEEELIMVRALIIMAPDREPPVDSALAREIYEKLSECLIYVLSRRFENPLPLFAKIIDRLTEARSQTKNAMLFYKTLKVDKYSNVLENPLLREMCEGIFFDCGDSDPAQVTTLN